jgi:hypothetical protein
MILGKMNIMMPMMISMKPNAGPPTGNPKFNQDILHLLLDNIMP